MADKNLHKYSFTIIKNILSNENKLEKMYGMLREIHDLFFLYNFMKTGINDAPKCEDEYMNSV